MSQINSVSAQIHPLFSNTTEVKPSGKIMGRDASVIRAAHSQLQEAAEELAFALDRSVDSSLRARQERGRNRSRLEKAKDYCDMLEAEDEAQADQKVKETLFDAFLNSEPEPEMILEEALRRWAYPEEAWAQVNRAYERAEQKGASPERLADLDQSVVLMERRYGAAIRAGLAGALVRDSHFLNSARKRGDTYRTAVLNCASTFDLYQYLVDNYDEDFSTAVDFLEKALALDLAEATPSKDREALHAFGQGLGRLQLLRSADESLRSLANDNISNTALLGRLLNLGRSSYPSAMDCVEISRSAGITELVDRILFLQNLLTRVRSFPPRLFDTEDGRMKVLDATQEAVDKAIAEEEELYS